MFTDLQRRHAGKSARSDEWRRRRKDGFAIAIVERNQIAAIQSDNQYFRDNPY